jgi:corrinoid protein of di/trimethylamine methyltransferase
LNVEREILDNLTKSVIQCDVKAAAQWAQKATDEGVDPIKGLDALTEAIRQVGDEFARGDLWLPDLVGSADALQAAMPILEAEVKRRGASRESLGVVVIGTVKGDIHTIGKGMVGTFLTAAGFEVHDIGVDVTAQQFVDAIRQYKADIVAMSALLTFTAPEQKRVIEVLKEAGIRDQVKVIVGGGAITEAFAKSIGADGYRPEAPAVVNLAKALLGIE